MMEEYEPEEKLTMPMQTPIPFTEQDEITPAESEQLVTLQDARAYINSEEPVLKKEVKPETKILKINMGQVHQSQRNPVNKVHPLSGPRMTVVNEQHIKYFLQCNSLESDTDESFQSSVLQRKYAQMMGIEMSS